MQTFLEYYEREIQPQIAAIDLFLKTEEPPYDSNTVAELLDISVEEKDRFLAEEKISFITRGVFFRLMEQGSAPLCGMFRRAVALGCPKEYTTEAVSYIFGLEPDTVQKASEKLGIDTFTEEMLPKLFSKISLAETRFLF